jgi:GNAT superfamily N-acetyltransferase
MIREADGSDLGGLLSLYTHLHDNPIPDQTEALHALWRRILGDEQHHIIVAEEEGRIVASCVCVIVLNLTRKQRPYAVIENVVTALDRRRRGLATACLNYAREIARRENCYKMMLMTGSRDEHTLRFYERAGYNRNDKTAFVQWLEV